MNRRFEAYWISPSGDIFPVNIHHINFISENKELFGITDEYYTSTFKSFKEKLGFEGKARQILMEEAFQKGWIRVRQSENIGWKIEMLKYSAKEKSNIEKWFNHVIASSYKIYINPRIRLIVHNSNDELNNCTVILNKIFIEVKTEKGCYELVDIKPEQV